MMRRVPICDLRSVDEVVDFLESAKPEQVIITDIDNTIAPQEASVAEFGRLVNGAIDRIEAHRNVARVIAVTNGPQREVDRLMSGGNKPWTSRRRLDLRGEHGPVVVIGDQVLTDGVLAWRLQATFLHLVIDDRAEQPRQAILRKLGRTVLSLLFSRADCRDAS